MATVVARGPDPANNCAPSSFRATFALVVPWLAKHEFCEFCCWHFPWWSSNNSSPSSSVGLADQSQNPKRCLTRFFDDLALVISIGRGPGRQDYLQRLEANNLAIINDVDDTVAHEVIDFDAKHWNKETLNQAAVKASSKKSFLATLRGSGGGKTRALEELRWELLGMDGVLPLAST